MTEEEMYENSKLWREENADTPVESELSMRSVGVTTGGISADMDAFEPAAEPLRLRIQLQVAVKKVALVKQEQLEIQVPWGSQIPRSRSLINTL